MQKQLLFFFAGGVFLGALLMWGVQETFALSSQRPAPPASGAGNAAATLISSQTEADVPRNVSAEEFPALVAKLTEEAASKNKDLAISDLFSRWSQQEPASLEAWIQAIPKSDLKTEAFNALVGSIAERHPQLALAIVNKLSPRSAGAALITLFFVWGKTDPHTAAAQLEKLTSPELREEATLILAQSWSHKNPQAAMDWVLGFPPDEPRQELLHRLLWNWAERDVAGIVGYLRQMPEGQDQQRGLEFIADYLIRRNPSKAVEVVALFPPNEAQDKRLRSLASAWASYDPEQARAWASQQTDKHVRDVVMPIVQSANHKQ